MNPRLHRSLAVSSVVASVALVAASASAGALDGPFSGGYSPRVPVSAFARPASWFDASRLRFSTEVSVGTGFGGQASGLQVTRMQYAFKGPMWLSVGVGNAFGGRTGNGSMFLEGVELAFKPTSSMFFRVSYRDFRSPLQYGYREPASPFGIIP